MRRSTCTFQYKDSHDSAISIEAQPVRTAGDMPRHHNSISLSDSQLKRKQELLNCRQFWSALLLELAPGHLVAVGDEVVLLGEGRPLDHKLARDLIALQRLVPRDIVNLCAYPGPQLGLIHIASCIYTQMINIVSYAE